MRSDNRLDGTMRKDHANEETTRTEDDISISIAEAALEIGAVRLDPINPTRWASGYHMPIYNDNRKFLFHPGYRRLVIDGFMEVIRENGFEPEVVAGTSTAGIPYGALLAERLDAPFVYVRDRPKDHGLMNRIEGIDTEDDLGGRTTLLIEDLISTGKSSLKAVNAIREAEGSIDTCVSIFDYGFDKSYKMFSEQGCDKITLSDYNTLVGIANQTGYITDEEMSLLTEWRQDLYGWGEKHGFPKRS
ncbi:MAG: orotate phosphoribosyltransferase [Candidatus Woesearchaeota archaeon]